MKTKFAIFSIGAIVAGNLLLPVKQSTMAENTDGNAIAVSLDDRVLRERIQTALRADERFEKAAIRVSVTDSVTSLVGMVPALKLVREASEIAYECGSTSVINELRVMTL